MTDLIGERWAPIKGPVYGLYEVSDQGYVRCIKPEIGRVRIDSFGIVEFMDYLGQKRAFSVAALVLAAFDRERPRGMWVEHKNGDLADNRFSNLRWTIPADRVVAQPAILPDVWVL